MPDVTISQQEYDKLLDAKQQLEDAKYYQHLDEQLQQNNVRVTKVR